LLDCCRAVRKRGEVVCIGLPWKKRTDLTAHDLHHLLFFNYPVVRSGWEWELPMQTEDFRPHSIYKNFGAALRWLADGRVKVDGLYASVSPADPQQVYQDLLHKRRKELFTVFDWRKLRS
jgi:threonine dehydrogenase-like Zn-dependent dehydrogenase